jgi:transposase
VINQRLGQSSREKVSAGVIVKGMLLNGLGFVSAPLYMFEKFFQGIATEHLLGEGVKAEQLNDDRLGDVLDQLYEAGLSETFVEISLQAVKKFEVEVATGHLDSTSFHVDGKYEKDEAGAVEITYGYSRDHRPDLKQFVMNLICVGEGDIPVMMEIANGNQADKARFAELLQEFKEQWRFDGLCVADAALYSAENLTAMAGLKWLTRVPLSIKQAGELAETTIELQKSKLKGYATTESVSEYGGVSQRWILVESQARRKSDIEKLDKKLEQIRNKCHQDLQTLGVQDFACESDATAAAQKLSAKMTWHQLSDIQVAEKRHYQKAGKPNKNDIPKRISYRVTATVTALEAQISAQRLRCGRFILATNILDAAKLTADDALSEYKRQQGTERGFRFLKDPLFFASSVFLKSRQRIEALGMIMALCLLVYNLGQRQLRLALARNQESIPNQLGKPTDSPTLRWVSQCFMAVHFVVFQEAKQIVNLTASRLHILKFLSESCRRYYMLPVPDS